MGDTFYNLLIALLVNDTNRYLGDGPAVISALCNLVVATASFVAAGVLVWFTRKSVLMRSTKFVYVAMGVLILTGAERLTHVLHVPQPVEMAFDIVTMVAALGAAILMVRKRHAFISMVYQFKYVVGLLRSIDRMED